MSAGANTGFVVKVQQGPYDGDCGGAECLVRYCLDCDFRWVKFSALRDLWEAGRLIPRCQDMPVEAFATEEEMLFCFEEVLEHRMPRAIAWVVSHPWLAKGHADPHGTQLDWLVRHISKGERLGYLQCSTVSFDYCCLPREPRGADELGRFRRALQNMHVSFSHMCTRVLFVDLPLPGHEENRVPWSDRGWCTFERYAGLMMGPGRAESLAEGRPRQSTETVAPAPEDFWEELQAKFFSSPTADRQNVANLYANLFSARVPEIVEADYCDLGGAGLGRLFKVLPHHERLEILTLRRCDLSGPETEAQLCELLRSTAHLRNLWWLLILSSDHGPQLLDQLRRASVARPGFIVNLLTDEGRARILEKEAGGDPFPASMKRSVQQLARHEAEADELVQGGSYLEAAWKYEGLLKYRSRLFSQRELYCRLYASEGQCWWRLRQQTGKEMARTKNECFERILEACDLALTLDPTLASTHYRRGCALEGLGRLPEAAQAFQQASQAEPGDAAIARPLRLVTRSVIDNFWNSGSSSKSD